MRGLCIKRTIIKLDALKGFEIILVCLDYLFIFINDKAAFDHRVFSRDRVMGLMEISLLYTCVLDVQDLGLGCQVSKLDSFFGLGVRRLSNTSLVGTRKTDAI